MSHRGEATGTGVRGAASSIHGLGEAIRGTINTAADSALGNDTSKNQAVTDRGIDEIHSGRYHGTGAGVTPADTGAERVNRTAQGEYPSNTAGTTGTTGISGFGSGSTAAGATTSSRYDPATSTRGDAFETTGTTSNAGYGTKHHTGTNYGASGDYGHPESTNAGPHSSNIANKVDPRVDSDVDNRARTGNTTGAAAGPHSSNLANKLDPRVDSDRDNRGATTGTTGTEPRRGSAATAGLQPTGGVTGRSSIAGEGLNPTDISGGYTTAETTTGHSGHGGNTGLSGVHDSHVGNNPHSSNHGPHGSKIANKLDPRVDSDADNRARTGNATGAAAGPHSSNLANKVDPRVDSDLDNRGTTGYGSTGTTGTTGYGSTGTTGITGTSGYGSTSTNAGPHDSNLANKADPRIDSDYDNRARTGNATGAAAGPHSSNLANKADPRVDSDLDNRGTTGYGSTGTTGTTGTTGYHTGSTTSTSTAGPHSSNLANKADPRVDSDRDNRANTVTGHTGTTTQSGYTDKSHARSDSVQEHGSHPSHGSGLVGKVLDKVDPRVKNA